ncbi:MAG: hypothetical protein JSR77_12715 [Planctomycetes bacterium]|nr:hypothetical protein [Planctomycetota bacterium]
MAAPKKKAKTKYAAAGKKLTGAEAFRRAIIASVPKELKAYTINRLNEAKKSAQAESARDDERLKKEIEVAENAGQ